MRPRTGWAVIPDLLSCRHDHQEPRGRGGAVLPAIDRLRRQQEDMQCVWSDRSVARL